VKYEFEISPVSQVTLDMLSEFYGNMMGFYHIAVKHSRIIEILRIFIEFYKSENLSAFDLM